MDNCKENWIKWDLNLRIDSFILLKFDNMTTLKMKGKWQLFNRVFNSAITKFQEFVLSNSKQEKLSISFLAFHIVIIGNNIWQRLD
jgi:hypothetical protein